MNDLAVRQTTDVAEFDPAAAKKKDAKLDAVIDYAKRVKRIMFQMMTKDAPKQRVLVIFGDKGAPVRAIEFLHGAMRQLDDFGIDRLRFYCSGWAQGAKSRSAA